MELQNCKRKKKQSQREKKYQKEQKEDKSKEIKTDFVCIEMQRSKNWETNEWERESEMKEKHTIKKKRKRLPHMMAALELKDDYFTRSYWLTL